MAVVVESVAVAVAVAAAGDTEELMVVVVGDTEGLKKQVLFERMMEFLLVSGEQQICGEQGVVEASF